MKEQNKRALELFKEYGNIEAKAVNNFLRLSFVAINKGFKGMQLHMFNEGAEDMHHSTMVMEFLNKYGMTFEPIDGELDEMSSKVESYEDFLNYFVWKEAGAASFSTKIYEAAKEDNADQEIIDMASKFIDIHVEEETEANELLDKYKELGQEEFDKWLFNKLKK